MMTKTARISALAFLAAPLLAACGPSGRSEGPEMVSVLDTPSTLFAPLYVAEAKGYFKAQGIKVQLENVQTGQDALPLVATGKNDVLVAGLSAGLFNALHRGLDIKVVGTMGKSPGTNPAPTALEVDKSLVDSGQIRTPADLRDRRVAVGGGAGAAGAYQLDATLRVYGLSIADVKVVNVSFPDMRAAIANHTVAAALPPAPFTAAMEKDGVVTNIAAPPKGTAASGVVMNSHFINSGNAKAFYRALQQAAKDLQGAGASSEENLRILAKSTGQAYGVLRAVTPYDFSLDLAPDTAQLQAQQQSYIDAHLLEYASPAPPATFVDTAVASP